MVLGDLHICSTVPKICGCGLWSLSTNSRSGCEESNGSSTECTKIVKIAMQAPGAGHWHSNDVQKTSKKRTSWRSYLSLSIVAHKPPNCWDHLVAVPRRSRRDWKDQGSKTKLDVLGLFKKERTGISANLLSKALVAGHDSSQSARDETWSSREEIRSRSQNWSKKTWGKKRKNHMIEGIWRL